MNAPMPPLGGLRLAADLARLTDAHREGLAALDAIGARLPLVPRAIPAGTRLLDWQAADGAAGYGECAIAGRTPDEVLVCCPCGQAEPTPGAVAALALAIGWAEAVANRPRPRFTWRFLFAPQPLGSIAWLACNRDARARVRHGLVLGGLGGGAFRWKRTRREDAPIDRIAAHVLRHDATANRVLPFEPWGGDERHFGSPGFDLPVGALSRASAAAARPEHLAHAFALLRGMEEAIEEDARFRGTAQYAEPDLARRGLRGIGAENRALLWVLNLSDGAASLLDIAERARLPFAEVRRAARIAVQAGLLVPACTGSTGW